MPERRRLPRPFHMFAVMVVCLSAALFVASWKTAPPALTLEICLVAAAAILSEGFRVLLPPVSFSLAYPLGMAALILGGPTAGAIVAALSAVTPDDFRERMPGTVMAFNVGQLSLVTMIAGWVYIGLGGRVLTSHGHPVPLGSGDFPAVVLPLLLAALVCGLGNDAAAAVATGLMGNRSFREATEAVVWLIPSQIALAFVGYLAAQVLSLNMVAFPLFIAPFVVASQLYQRYANLKAAFADTVRSLVGALEAKDPYTRGHSERVSKYATALGSAMRLEAGALERLEYAALLHDLGKLAVPGSVLAKPGRLEPEEMDRIREHPSRGAEMVDRIPPLKDLAETVRQHHERVDGTGYPSGKPGGELSLAARILAVADSYDAMTTTRAYRAALSKEQALEELIGGSGTQFDAGVVRVFVDADVATSVGDAEVPLGGESLDQDTAGRG